MLPVTAYFDIAQKALDAVVNHWDAGAEPLPDRQYISDGAMVWDGCEFLTVLFDASFGTSGDIGGGDQYNVDVMSMAIRAAHLGVGLFRCVPTLSDDAEASPPTPAEIQDSANLILRDGVSVFNALVIAKNAGELGFCNDIAFERYTSQVPQGGLGGGITQFRALLL